MLNTVHRPFSDLKLTFRRNMPLPTASNAVSMQVQAGVEPMQVDDVDDDDGHGRNEEALIVAHPTLDLESYAASFKGHARLFRLQYIADHCPSLSVEAWRMALVYVVNTYNTSFYTMAHTKLRDALEDAGLPNAVAGSVQGTPVIDTQWIEATNKRAAIKIEKLDTDLKNYKANSIKESIRRGHDDLGDHYLECGDLNNSLKCFTRSRDYCTSAKHMILMCLNVIKVSVYLGNWSHVLNYVQKAENQADITDHLGKDAPAVVSQLKCAAGLAELHARKYKNAAKQFLLASFDHTDFPEMMSASNVATYGGLCALATFDRQELQQHVVSSTGFKQFLELEPQVRDIILKFHNSRYAECLTLMQSVKDNLLMDIYLARHVDNLYAMIRNRALCQYFSPYMSADMRKMAAAFNTSVPELEDEIMKLILEREMTARIDSHRKILYAKATDARNATYEKALQVGEEYQRRTRGLLVRAALVRHHVVVKSNSREATMAQEISMSPGNAGASRN